MTEYTNVKILSERAILSNAKFICHINACITHTLSVRTKYGDRSGSNNSTLVLHQVR